MFWNVQFLSIGAFSGCVIVIVGSCVCVFVFGKLEDVVIIMFYWCFVFFNDWFLLTVIVLWLCAEPTDLYKDYLRKPVRNFICCGGLLRVCCRFGLLIDCCSLFLPSTGGWVPRQSGGPPAPGGECFAPFF